jgi:hypothetical protein
MKTCCVFLTIILTAISCLAKNPTTVKIHENTVLWDAAALINTVRRSGLLWGEPQNIALEDGLKPLKKKWDGKEVGAIGNPVVQHDLGEGQCFSIKPMGQGFEMKLARSQVLVVKKISIQGKIRLNFKKMPDRVNTQEERKLIDDWNNFKFSDVNSIGFLGFYMTLDDKKISIEDVVAARVPDKEAKVVGEIPPPLPARLENREYRVWTDTKGHSVEAAFIGHKGLDITLRKRNGKEITLPISTFSRDDLEWLLKEGK